MGLLSCFTLNFSVKNEYLEGADAQFSQWRTWPRPQVISTVSLGATQILITENMLEASTLVHEHFTSQVLSNDFYHASWDHPETHLDYIPPPTRHTDITIHYIVTNISPVPPQQ
jgi:hypothetical protein